MKPIFNSKHTMFNDVKGFIKLEETKFEDTGINTHVLFSINLITGTFFLSLKKFPGYRLMSVTEYSHQTCIKGSA